MALNTWDAKLVLDAKAQLGEGPCWDAERGQLYWIDIAGESVHCFDPAAGTNQTIPVGQKVGAVVQRESGGLLVAMHHGLYELEPETGKLTFLTDPEKHLPGNRFNDGKCDPAGRFWAGTMHMEETEPTATLYVLNADRTLESRVGDITTSNGLTWSPDGKTMYYIDSPTRTVSAFDYDSSTGTVANRRIIIRFDVERGSFPDGMTADSEGMLWIAEWGGYQVSRWNPQTGEQIGTVRVASPKVTSCAFGGDDLQDLYITTASINNTAEQQEAYPQAGGIFHVRTGVTGVPTYRYRG
ncbi:SMP-30/gluconolactonase/LRE family protein [Paenibacillus sp. y28]|uniref:SMP-30/gluconolactonase/LRE family protein n=1 Tax=Paenibacillus sp. y28 TaxID=3129110 RepID=UPI00301B621A